MNLFNSKFGYQFLSIKRIVTFALFVLMFEIAPIVYGAPSDLNHDKVVDLEDLKAYSLKYLNISYDQVDWCLWLEQDYKSKKWLGAELELFIFEYYNCGQAQPPEEDPFKIIHNNVYPTRLAWGPNGNLYVTDAKRGSVFIYDPNFTITGELKSLGKPLGLVVDTLGNIYVGSSKRMVVEVYNSQGIKTNTIGLGLIEMPSDLALDNDGRLYVVDSKKNTVWVFDPNGGVLRSIGKPGDGDGGFEFPIALEIAYRNDPNGQQIPELYVADRGHYLIQVFDLNGNFKRSFGTYVTQSMMGGWRWQGKFVKLQGLTMDSTEYLHVLDCYMNKVQILNPETGSFMGYYGDSGSADDQLKLPFDVILDADGNAIVTDTGNKRIETFILTP